MSLAYETLPGDIDHLIADDHAIVARQFEHLETAHGNRRILVQQIIFELSLHMFAEETVLYPAWDDAGMTSDRDIAIAEHKKIKELCAALAKQDPGTFAYENSLADLIAQMRAHVADEEGLELPKFRGIVGPAKMGELGEMFVAAKRKAPSGPHPNAPSHGGFAEKVAGMLVRPFDNMRAKARGIADKLATDATGTLHPQAQALVDAYASLHPLPVETLEPEEARRQPGPAEAVKKLLESQGRATLPEPVGSIEDLAIPDAAGGAMRLRVYRPSHGVLGAPILMWIHGGGWVLFTIDDHYDASCRALCNKTGAIVVTPDYRRAPEAVFPASHDDVLAAYRWVASNALALGGDPSRIAIGGESVGGNMCAATVLQLAELGEPRPIAMVSVYPVTTAEQYGASMIDAADGRPLNRAQLSWLAMHAFKNTPDAGHDRRIDLLGWTRAQLGMMPPTLVITDERDVLRSQGQAFAQKLADAGVPTVHRYYAGVMHEFFGASAVLELAEQAQREAAEHLLRAFRGQPPLSERIDLVERTQLPQQPRGL